MSQMIQDVRVSVIIPVHNSEKYLGQCLQSVLHQTFREIEILCIDGGSTDSLNAIDEVYSLIFSAAVLISHSPHTYISITDDVIILL